jgi:hypothetical protein
LSEPLRVVVGQLGADLDVRAGFADEGEELLVRRLHPLADGRSSPAYGVGVRVRVSAKGLSVHNGQAERRVLPFFLLPVYSSPGSLRQDASRAA